MVFTLTIPRRNTKENERQRRYFNQLCILIIVVLIIFTFFLMILMISLLLPDKLEAFYPRISPRYIYIDIGCYNGETIEHFIHFVPNSSRYDIITFEPDPYNYQLCEQRLRQQKYANMSITILPKVVWIRDEKVFFHTDLGRFSRIQTNETEKDGIVEQIDAIDFSAWLARLARPKKTKISIKMSMYGSELPVLDKMVLDNTLGLAEKYQIEWTDRQNPRVRSLRIYLQLMFDNRGFDLLYYTYLPDVKKVFNIFGKFEEVTKHYDWRTINESDTFAHYQLRPDKFELPLKLKSKPEDTK